MKIGRKYGEKEKIKILIKSLIFRTLRIYIFSFYAFLFFVSFADAANRRYMNFSELNNVGMKFEPKNQGVQYVDIQHDTNSVTFL